ncbi:hypothetical protein LUZ60_012718 [Juncus effusus]|nr:hypothetical protein LUZ60_012718 [Juncus effusus]
MVVKPTMKNSKSPYNHGQQKLFSIFFFLAIGFTLGIITSSKINWTPFYLSSSSSNLFLNKLKHTTKQRVGLNGYTEPFERMHDMGDQELFWRASMVPRLEKYPYKRVPKIAFLFLVKREIPFAPLWEEFFNGNRGLYSIYVHRRPSYKYSARAGSVFYKRTIPSKATRWGRVNIMDAERRLLANALLDFSNERFILLSQSHIPLFNFSTIYSYLINSNSTYIESYDKPGPAGRARYKPNMGPTIMPANWRKGSQWFEMDRKLAIEVISDDTYYPLFTKFCKSCVADEHYLPTFVNIKRWHNVENRSLTWVDWSEKAFHPKNFLSSEVAVEFLEKLKYGSSCNYNGRETRVCFLFARKFLPNCLGKLLEFAPKIMGFG